MNGRDRFDRIYKESVEYLDSVSALDLMRDAEALHKDIYRDIARYNLPVSVIIGVLMNEIQYILDKGKSLGTEKAIIELDKGIKRYLDENFMKKEKIQERR